MIPQLASPSVCVIDDEESDYRPILDALMRLGLGCVHVKGDTSENLPPQPFRGLRLVFTDLHLGTFIGKDAASHTANVFKAIVSPETAPVVVVIWSKYANDVPESKEDIPPDDQPTEADLFKQALLAAVPQFQERLVFLQMPKPKPSDRPNSDGWIDELKEKIKETLQEADAFSALWSWETMVRDAGLEVSKSLTELAVALLPHPSSKQNLHDRLALLLKRLAQQQGGPDCSELTASRHLLTVLSQLCQEKLEISAAGSLLDSHGKWLATTLDDAEQKQCRSSQINSLILTSDASATATLFPPGRVYKIADNKKFEDFAGFSIKNLQEDCFQGKYEALQEFQNQTSPILLEVSPLCDFHQGNRRSALLLAGIVCPHAILKKAKSKDACLMTPIFEGKIAGSATELALIFCSRYRLTINHDVYPLWLRPWIQLRDVLTTEIRNWHASQAARVGYLRF